MSRIGKLLLALILVWMINPGYSHWAMASGGAAVAVHKQMKAGNEFTLLLDEGGRIWSWGNNEYGTLGDRTKRDRLTPDLVTGLSEVKGIAAGADFALALKIDGTVWAWGDNFFGQLGLGHSYERNTEVQVSGLSDVKTIAAGADHALALKNDGTVWSWGLNANGQLGDGTMDNGYFPAQVSGLSDVTAIFAGFDQSFAVKTDGTVWAWGMNNDGQLGTGIINYYQAVPMKVQGLSDVVAIAGGGNHTIALKNDGTVWAWGDNGYGQLGNNGITDNTSFPVQVTGLDHVKSIAAGRFHSLAVKNDGTVWSWGLNSYGELGDGTNTNRDLPVEVTGLTDITEVSSMVNHNVALKKDGTVWGWGANYEGQLGDGSTGDQSIPTQALIINPQLGGLDLSDGRLSPSLSSEVNEYRVVVAKGKSGITVTPREANASATASMYNASGLLAAGPFGLTNDTASDLLPLASGDNRLEITLTPQWGPVKTYILTVIQANDNAELNNLEITGGTLSAAPSPAVNAYTADVANSIASVKVKPTAADAAATITVNGKPVASGADSEDIPLSVGNNTILVVTTAQDGITKKTYTINVTRASAPSRPSLSGNARLGGITLSSGELTPAFSSSIQEYRTTVPDDVDKLVITPIAEHSQATIRLNGKLVPGGEASQPIILAVGETTIEIAVTAADGTVADYRIVVTRTPQPCVNDGSRLSDIAGHWSETFVKQAACAGIAGGYPDGTFKPNAPITRAEFLVMLMNAIRAELTRAATVNVFADQAEIQAWAVPAIGMAYAKGIAQGYPDGTIRPNARINRAEMATLAARAFDIPLTAGDAGFADDSGIPEWATGAVHALKEQGVLNGKGNGMFHAEAEATRSEAVVVILKLHRLRTSDE
ncbi:RCC1 domain-containing protein [Paenibacillus glycanilyticus]|uniref:RCC1 domain-containing protein n=1 Tax=Paenibacillus glycanilyticus TaxID=126569 RepID=UPI000FDBD2CA|nr:cadherin-like beta sandwich domain-containing protein [Paenibacillus glycanilyticus]